MSSEIAGVRVVTGKHLLTVTTRRRPHHVWVCVGNAEVMTLRDGVPRPSTPFYLRAMRCSVRPPMDVLWFGTQNLDGREFLQEPPSMLSAGAAAAAAFRSSAQTGIGVPGSIKSASLRHGG